MIYCQLTGKKINPQAPFHLLIPQNTDLLSEYEHGWKITEIMPVNSVGIVTARDALTIHWTKAEICQTVQEFVSLEPEQAREKYNLGKDARDWKVSFAQDDLRMSGLSEDNIVQILYRPFDIRYTYYTGNSRGFHCMPRSGVMRHILFQKNIGFHLCRQTSIANWAHILTTEYITDDCYVSNKTSERGYTFPLYLYPQRNSLTIESRPNFSTEFLQDIIAKLGYAPIPESIFYYLYAVVYSPTYRIRYAEFLKIDFPRIPLTSNDSLFRQLAEYGEELVTLHLMKSSKLDMPITYFVEAGGDSSVRRRHITVEPGHPKYDEASGSVLINKKGDKFTGVPKAV